MKLKFRMYRSSKSGYYYWQDNDTGKQGTLGTADKREAQRLFNAKNEACRTSRLSPHLHLGEISPRQI